MRERGMAIHINLSIDYTGTAKIIHIVNRCFVHAIQTCA